MFLSDAQTKAQSDIQELNKEACLKVSTKEHVQTQLFTKDASNSPQADSSQDLYQIEKIFESHLSTIVLFIDQDPYFNVAMNLDVNCCRVHQENFTLDTGSSINDAIFVENGATFQNSPIHLLFYEKVYQTNNLLPFSSDLPKLTSMNLCRLKKIPH